MKLAHFLVLLAVMALAFAIGQAENDLPDYNTLVADYGTHGETSAHTGP